MRWLQLLKEFNCTATSTWTNNDDSCACHTWRAWGSPVCKKQLDQSMGQNKVRLRTCDHFSVILKIEGRDLKTKKGMKGWASWIPRSEDETSRFQELVLCSGDGRVGTHEDGDDGLAALLERLEEAAAAVKATTTALRNRNKFTVPDEIREMAAEAATCRDLVTKLWINGRASEDRDEWTEEVRVHCEKCYDDKMETSEVQAERIRHQRSRADSLAVHQGRHFQITVDRVLRAWGKMMKNKANGPADCLVTEMLQCLPMDKQFKGECRVPEAWKGLRLACIKKSDAKFEKGLRGFRAIVLWSVLLKW